MNEKEDVSQGDSISSTLDSSGSDKETIPTTDEDSLNGVVHSSVEQPVLTDYTEYLDYQVSLSIFIIFILGIISGLITARIMWGRVKH